MMYQKYYKNSGSIVFEVIFVTTLTTLLCVLMTNISVGSEKVFESALAKEQLLDTMSLTQEMPFSFSMCSPYIAHKNPFGSYIRNRMTGLARQGTYQSPKSLAGSLNIIPVDLSRVGIEVRNKITDIEVRNSVWYISTDSSTYSDHDLFVIDVKNTSSPVKLFSANTGPGISSIHVDDKIIYTAVASTQRQLDEFVVYSPSQIELRRSITLELPTATSTRPFGTSIHADDERIFLGTEKWDGDEFIIFDRETFAKIFAYNVDSKVNDINSGKDSTGDDRGVIGDDDSGAIFVAGSAYEQLMRFDPDDSGEWYLDDIFSPRGWSRQEGTSINLGERILFTRSPGGFDVANDHEVFLWDQGQKQDGYESYNLDEFDVSMNLPGGAYGAVPDSDFVFVAGGHADRALNILDPKLSTSTMYTAELPLGATTMTCYMSRLYIVGDGAPVIYIIEFL